MVKITVQLEDDFHLKLLEIQLDRKRRKVEPTAINKIASEILQNALKNENPSK